MKLNPALDQNNAKDAVNISFPKETNDTSHVQVFLPTLEVEYICGYDMRPSFNTTETFGDLYQTLLPDMTEPHLTHIEKMTGMDLLKLYGSKWLKRFGCNETSTEVLMTFKVKGFAFFDRDSKDIASMTEVINHHAVREYFSTNVCSDLSQFRVFVESPFRKESKSNEFDQVQHNFGLLCEGGITFGYDKDEDYDGDPIFVLFGIFVGYYMVRMVVSELQKYGRNRRQQRYEGLPSEEEVEMM